MLHSRYQNEKKIPLEMQAKDSRDNNNNRMKRVPGVPRVFRAAHSLAFEVKIHQDIDIPPEPNILPPVLLEVAPNPVFCG